MTGGPLAYPTPEMCTASQLELKAMMQVDIGKLLDLKIELEKELEVVSECAISSTILKSELYLGKIRDIKIDYQLEIFILDMFIQVFLCFFFDRFLIILGGEGGCLDWFFIRLLTRDPPSEVCSMQR